MSALPEHVSTVRVTEPVDGTRARRRKASGGQGRRQLATAVDGFRVDPRVMAAARRAMRPNQRLVIVGPDEVRIVNA